MSRIGDIMYRHIDANRELFPHKTRTVIDAALREIDEFVSGRLAQLEGNTITNDAPQFHVVTDDSE